MTSASIFSFAEVRVSKTPGTELWDVKDGCTRGYARAGDFDWRQSCWMKYMSCLVHLSGSHSVLYNCTTEEASMTPSFSRSFLEGARNDKRSARDNILAELGVGTDCLGAHTRCFLLLLLMSTPRHVWGSGVFGMLEHKQEIMESFTIVDPSVYVVFSLECISGGGCMVCFEIERFNWRSFSRTDIGLGLGDLLVARGHEVDFSWPLNQKLTVLDTFFTVVVTVESLDLSRAIVWGFPTRVSRLSTVL